MFKIWKTAEPTTMKRKNPNRTGPTGNLSSFFYSFILIYIILLMRKVLSLSSQCSFDMPRSLLSFASDSTSFISVPYLPFFIYNLLFILFIIIMIKYCIIYTLFISLYIKTLIYRHLFNRSARDSIQPPFFLCE